MPIFSLFKSVSKVYALCLVNMFKSSFITFSTFLLFLMSSICQRNWVIYPIELVTLAGCIFIEWFNCSSTIKSYVKIQDLGILNPGCTSISPGEILNISELLASSLMILIQQSRVQPTSPFFFKPPK